jgi:putative heme-binding domain-containing protein
VLQDVITPSRDVDPAFRTTIVFTRDGGMYTGLLVEESANSVVIMDGDGAEQTFLRSEIHETRQEWISAMPSGFGAIIPEPDFLDLVAFLLNPPSKMVRLTSP